MVNRNYSSTAAETTLQAGITGSGTIAQVVGTSGFPVAPFTLVLDPGTLYEELVTVTSVASTTLTITRGEDGTSGVSHEAGAVVRHVVSARDLTEAAQHIAASTNVHGVGSGSAVVGTQTSQTLRNKTIDSSNDVDKGALPSDVVYRTGSQTLSDKTIDSSNSIAKGALPSDVLFATGSKTVSDKTIDGSNTVDLAALPAVVQTLALAHETDTGFGSSATGWSTGSTAQASFIIRDGSKRTLYLEQKRTAGSDISPTATGSIGNFKTFQLDEPGDFPNVSFPVAGTYYGTPGADYGCMGMVFDDGRVELIYMSPSSPLAGGRTAAGDWSLRFYTSWYVD